MSSKIENVLFSYESEDLKEQIEYPIVFLQESPPEEYVYIIMNTKELPIYIKNDLLLKLNKCISEVEEKNYDSQVNKIIENVKANTFDVEDIIKTWEKRIREEIFEYSERRCASDEELFAMAYHKLVHSPVLETMLKLEHSYAKKVRKRIEARDRQVEDLKNNQGEEMTNALENLNITTDEKSINDLVAKHFEDLSLLQGKWSSELDTLKEVQRREYREWVMQMLEENQTNNSISTPSNSPLNVCNANVFSDTLHSIQDYKAPQYEESFTIHLGSQLKQMHNIRIMSTDVMDFCRVNVNIESPEPTPHSLQTALVLYSNDLCGLVLMTDNHIDSYSKMLKDFTQICQCSTEFHFSHFEDQLDIVRDNMKINIAIMDSQMKNLMHPQKTKSKSSKHLQSGDVYVTRHSNLAQMHVVFHIVTDDSLLSREINSRHPVLLGLRNILKTACSNDITSLTIPLLLQYEMTEEMTVTWCTKRAELVFKCVKGFMIEMASWGGSELKNLQFLLPPTISSSVFQSLTSMLPNIFKLSNPLVLKSSTTK